MGGLFSIPKKRAVLYARHSDERQENSADIQAKAIREFAAQHHIEVLEELVDKGISGMTEKRPAFQRLMRYWIEDPDAPRIDYVLVYDISRFGRFIDTDKSAALEHACKKRGIELVAIVRGIPSGDQLSHDLIRAIDRHTSADFIKILSKKVKLGALEVSQQGYSAGGHPSYGLDRLLLDEKRKPVQILKPGEQKMISNQRVAFVPAEGQPGKIVQRIFSEFVERGRLPEAIADGINHDDIPSPAGKRWRPAMIRKILLNPSYIGCLLYNKTSGPLHTPRRRNLRRNWIVVPHAFPPLVPTETFSRAQELLHADILAATSEHKRLFRLFRHFLVNGAGVSAMSAPVALPYTKENMPSWCFRLRGRMREDKQILCVGLAAGSYAVDAYIPGGETFFLVPVEHFGVCRYVMCENGSPYQVDVETAEKFIGGGVLH